MLLESAEEAMLPSQIHVPLVSAKHHDRQVDAGDWLADYFRT